MYFDLVRRSFWFTLELVEMVYYGCFLSVLTFGLKWKIYNDGLCVTNSWQCTKIKGKLIFSVWYGRQGRLRHPPRDRPKAGLGQNMVKILRVFEIFWGSSPRESENRKTKTALGSSVELWRAPWSSGEPHGRAVLVFRFFRFSGGMNPKKSQKPSEF